MSHTAYANLKIDRLSLLLPQTDLLHSELVSKIQPPDSDRPGLGCIEYDQHLWPVYTVNERLSPLDSLPEQRRLAVFILPGTDRRLALACDSLTTLSPADGDIFEELPGIMHTRHSPIKALLYSDGNLHCISSAAELGDLLLDGEERK